MSRPKRISYRILIAAVLALALLAVYPAEPVKAADTDVVFTSQSFDSTPAGRKLSSSAARSDKVVVKDVDYDRSDREVEFEFKGSVQWSSPTVKITRNGSNYARYIKGKDSDELEVKVKKLTYGATYSYRITGVKKRTGSKYQTVTGTFRAVGDDDDDYDDD